MVDIGLKPIPVIELPHGIEIGPFLLMMNGLSGHLGLLIGVSMSMLRLKWCRAIVRLRMRVPILLGEA